VTDLAIQEAKRFGLSASGIFSQLLSYGGLALPRITWKLRSSQAARKTVPVPVHVNVNDYVNVHVDVNVNVVVDVDGNGSGHAKISSRLPDTPHN